MSLASDDREMSWFWLLYSAIATTLSALLIVVNDVTGTLRSLVSAGIIVGLFIVYVIVIPLRGCSFRVNSWRSWCYVVIAVAGYLAALALNPWANVSLFVLAPQVFFLLSPFAAAAVVVTANALGLFIQILGRDLDGSDRVQLVSITAVIILASIFYSNRLSWVSAQSHERGELIARLREQQQEIARLSEQEGAASERDRIAREMHDTLAQGFASIVTLGHALQVQPHPLPPQVERHIELITQTAQENLAESRRIIDALTPGWLDASTLADALVRVTQRFTDETGVSAECVVTGERRSIPAQIEVVVLRVVQEALSNVRKHAEASRVSVKLERLFDTIRVTITDNGCGFTTASSRPGFGLTGMAARVDEVSGEFRVDSEPGRGTTVTALVAFPPPSDDIVETEVPA